MTLERRTPLKRTGFTAKSATWRNKKKPWNSSRKPRPPVRTKSPRRSAEEKEYAKLRSEILRLDDPHAPVGCVAGPLLAQFGIFGCTAVATELHHLRKRSSNGALCNPANVVPTCHHCNTVSIEQHPVEARLVGLVVRSGDPGWDALSARAWRER